jgi:hypothetical protein
VRRGGVPRRTGNPWHAEHCDRAPILTITARCVGTRGRQRIKADTESRASPVQHGDDRASGLQLE